MGSPCNKCGVFALRSPKCSIAVLQHSPLVWSGLSCMVFAASYLHLVQRRSSFQEPDGLDQMVGLDPFPSEHRVPTRHRSGLVRQTPSSATSAIPFPHRTPVFSTTRRGRKPTSPHPLRVMWFSRSFPFPLCVWGEGLLSLRSVWLEPGTTRLRCTRCCTCFAARDEPFVSFLRRCRRTCWSEGTGSAARPCQVRPMERKERRKRKRRGTRARKPAPEGEA